MTDAPRIACEPAATVSETALAEAKTRAVLRRRLLDARTSTDPSLQALRVATLSANLQAWLEQHLPGLWNALRRDFAADASAAVAGEVPGSAPDNVLGVYWPIRGEPDLRPFYATLAATGVRLALPVMTGRNQPLQFAMWAPEAALATDRWGIATPETIIPVAPLALLIPCVGFTATRHRLGYGGGFYDRTLALTPRPVAIGIAWDHARCDFTAAAHDIPMDVVLTESQPA